MTSGWAGHGSRVATTVALLAASLAGSAMLAGPVLKLKDGREIAGTDLRREGELYALLIEGGAIIPVPVEAVREIAWIESGGANGERSGPRSLSIPNRVTGSSDEQQREADLRRQQQRSEQDQWELSRAKAQGSAGGRGGSAGGAPTQDRSSAASQGQRSAASRSDTRPNTEDIGASIRNDSGEVETDSGREDERGSANGGGTAAGDALADARNARAALPYGRPSAYGSGVILAGPDIQPPTTAEQLAVFGQPSQWAQDVVHFDLGPSYWVPDPKQASWAPSEFMKMPRDSTWTPTDGFATSGH